LASKARYLLKRTIKIGKVMLVESEYYLRHDLRINPVRGELNTCSRWPLFHSSRRGALGAKALKIALNPSKSETFATVNSFGDEKMTLYKVWKNSTAQRLQKSV
jgi:hypothetical protein